MTHEPRGYFSMPDGVYVDSDFGAYPAEAEAPEGGQVRLWVRVVDLEQRDRFAEKRCELEWAR